MTASAPGGPGGPGAAEDLRHDGKELQASEVENQIRIQHDKKIGISRVVLDSFFSG